MMSLVNNEINKKQKKIRHEKCLQTKDLLYLLRLEQQCENRTDFRQYTPSIILSESRLSAPNVTVIHPIAIVHSGPAC